MEKNTPFFTVKTLITRLLELDSCKNIHEREQLILQHITDDDMRLMLPLLNDILIMKVPLILYLSVYVFTLHSVYCTVSTEPPDITHDSQ